MHDAVVDTRLLSSGSPVARPVFRSAPVAVFAAGIVLVALALVVLAAWHLGNRGLVQVVPGAAPMQYSTALAFLCLGAALVALTRHWTAAALAASCLAALFGLATLIQYQTGIDLAVDRIGGTPFVTDKTSHPGRMAPNTAFCFLLAGVGIALLSLRGRDRAAITIVALFGSLVLGLGLVAVIGYALGLEEAYGWGDLTRMAIHTGSGFVIAGAAAILAAWRASAAIGRPLPRWLAVCTAFAILAIVLSLYLAVRAELAESGASNDGHADIGMMTLVFGLCLAGSVAATMSYAIHARNQAAALEAEIHEREAAERETAQAWGLMEAAAENVPVGFAIFGADEAMRMCNHAYWSTFYPTQPKPGELPTFADLMRHSTTLRLVPGLERAPASERERWIEERLRQFRDGTGTVTRKLRDGRWFKVQQTSLPDGGMVLVQTDITELKDREETLVRSNTELERFAHVASHDLREPLRKILTFSGILSDRHGDALTGPARDLLQRIDGAAGRMDALISDLLDYARVEQADRPFERVDLNRVVADMVAELDVAIQDAGAEVEVTELPAVDGDPLHLRQLFQNLISNAIKFRKPDVPPRIRIRWTDRLDDAVGLKRIAGVADTCEIRVEDNGVGFDQSYAESIFEIFRRLHSRSEYPGTGVGLGICRRVVERMGGTIAATGRPGDGAVFTIHLPFKQAQGPKV